MFLLAGFARGFAVGLALVVLTAVVFGLLFLNAGFLGVFEDAFFLPSEAADVDVEAVGALRGEVVAVFAGDAESWALKCVSKAAWEASAKA